MEPRSSATLINTLGAWASAGSILIAQVAVWISTGSWPNWRFSDAWGLVGVPDPGPEAGAVGGVLHWIGAWPLGVAVFVCMAVFSALIAPRRPQT